MQVNVRKLAEKKNLTRAIFVVIGAAVGFAYYHFVGCASGTCPITGNPYMSTMYGGLLGFTIALVKED